MRNIKTREGFEFWDKLCALPRYAFLLSPSGSAVQKFEDRAMGNWIDVYEAQAIVDQAQDRISELQEEVSRQLQRSNDFASKLSGAQAVSGELQQLLTAADEQIDLLTPRHTEQPEGKRERFEKWVMATKHPVYGFLDGRSLARGDDRTGYADEYVQGLWVAYLEFGAAQSQGEPVARHPDAIIEGVMTSVGISHAIYASTVTLKHGEQVKLYAEQPAPVAVNSLALTELRHIFDSNKGADGTLVISKKLAAKILNPSL